ncbi:Uncharacterised protein g6536 [Pycnogonum litorale]
MAVAMTSQPTNESELQLYRVLQRANLLSYYDTFIGQGGDDVHQLCEAGEEEFLEIMALVGMASKPLHVRRLQKALQEWVTNPGLFQTPFVPNHSMMLPVANRPPPPPINTAAAVTPAGGHPSLPTAHPSPPIPMLPSSNHRSSPSPILKDGSIPSPSSAGMQTAPIMQSQRSPGPQPTMTEYGQPSSPLTLTPVLVESQIQRLSESAGILIKSLPSYEPKAPNNKKKICKELEYVMSMPEDDPRRIDGIRKYAAIYGRFDCKRKPEKPLTLHEVSVNEAAAQICKHIPALLTRRDELFPLARQVVRLSGYQYSKGHSSLEWNSSKEANLQQQQQQSSPPTNGYTTAPTNKHPRCDTSLLNNNPWIQMLYGNNPTNIQRSQSTKYGDEEAIPQKRPRLEGRHDGHTTGGRGAPVDPHVERQKRQERVENINEELKSISIQQEELKSQIQKASEMQDFRTIHQMQSQLEQLQNQQLQLFTEQSDLSKQVKRLDRYLATEVGLNNNNNNNSSNGRASSCSDVEKPDTDDTDSQFSCSNASSPSHDNQDSSSQDANHQMNDVFKASRKANAQITKQLVQETLMDEGLRVVKELASQIKDNAENGGGNVPSTVNHQQHDVNSPFNSRYPNQTSPSPLTHGQNLRNQRPGPVGPHHRISGSGPENCQSSLPYNHVPPPPPPLQDGIDKIDPDKNAIISMTTTPPPGGRYMNDVNSGIQQQQQPNNNSNENDNSAILLNLQTKKSGIKLEPSSPSALH